jgi:response regulator RpfG family c-di-GMP phosphodiesterase
MTAANEDATVSQPLILVVDDDPIILRVVSRLLTERGYRVLVAPDGQAAWELLQGPPSLPVDLILTDVRMPRMGGAEFGTLVGSSRPEIPVLHDRLRHDGGMGTPRGRPTHTTTLEAVRGRGVADTGG